MTAHQVRNCRASCSKGVATVLLRRLTATGITAGIADKRVMGIDAIIPVSATNLKPEPPVLLPIHWLDAIETSPATATLAGANISARTSDNVKLSPMGELVGTLQQLQKTDPIKYAQVTQLIATNLQTAAATAQTQGNSSEAEQLTALAAEFSSVSKSGQVSTLVQNLTQVANESVGGGKKVGQFG